MRRVHAHEISIPRDVFHKAADQDDPALRNEMLHFRNDVVLFRRQFALFDHQFAQKFPICLVLFGGDQVEIAQFLVRLFFGGGETVLVVALDEPALAVLAPDDELAQPRRMPVGKVRPRQNVFGIHLITVKDHNFPSFVLSRGKEPLPARQWLRLSCFISSPLPSRICR